MSKSVNKKLPGVRHFVRRHIEQAYAKQVLPRLDLYESTCATFERVLNTKLTMRECALLLRCMRQVKSNKNANLNDNHSHLLKHRATKAWNANIMSQRASKWSTIYK